MKNQAKPLILFVILLSIFSCSEDKFSEDLEENLKPSAHLKYTVPDIRESEPNNTMATADVIGYGLFEYSGTLMNDDQEPKYDYIKLFLDDTCTLVFEGSENNMFAELIDDQGNTLTTLYSMKDIYSFRNNDLSGGYYYLRVSGQNLGDYLITVLGCNVSFESEPNNNLSSPDFISDCYIGSNYLSDDYAIFKINANSFTIKYTSDNPHTPLVLFKYFGQTELGGQGYVMHTYSSYPTTIKNYPPGQLFYIYIPSTDDKVNNNYRVKINEL